MSDGKAHPTVDEIYELLKRSELPTVLVEGKDDIIFYRAVEQELRSIDVDMLPAGNKFSVLQLKKKIESNPISAPTVFIVDKDLWVYPNCKYPDGIDDVITTTGYSIENDLAIDGDLEFLMTENEVKRFKDELALFSRWFALSVMRNLDGKDSTFRTHPKKVLEDTAFYNAEMTLQDDEIYPEELYSAIMENYRHYLRGKSLFALLLRQLSEKKRDVKFSGKQLMWIGASRKGENFLKIQSAVKNAFERLQERAETI